MDFKTLCLAAVLGVLGGAAWFYLVYIGKVPADTFVSTMQMGLGALIAHLINQAANNAAGVAAPAIALPVAPGPVPAPLAQKQGGFAYLWFIVICIACALAAGVCLTGCAAAYRQTLTESVAQAKAADDNLVLTYKAAICGLPLSAILRNADIIPGIKALCLPGGNASDPNGILPTPQQAPVQVQIVPQQSAPLKGN